MIQNFNDHAANERTYLAWVRTAIAVMAFGFLIEKFNIFMRIVAKGLNVETNFVISHTAEILGIAIMLLSVAILLIASIRFTLNRERINAQMISTYTSRVPDIFLGILLILITTSMVIYAWYILM
ncbi:YidH family protein [Facilibium subflavum]|uniref:YidH family protein n=1 Tax=Facilibium subflavum TaxID=2219058 RepID=UPI000E6520CB|nr:DUF202 domain-containing protein [Facilibium subflavum]